MKKTGLTISERARRLKKRQEARFLSDRDRDVFLALLNAPANPNEVLRGTAEDFKQAVKSGVLVLPEEATDFSLLR